MTALASVSRRQGSNALPSRARWWMKDDASSLCFLQCFDTDKWPTDGDGHQACKKSASVVTKETESMNVLMLRSIGLGNW